MHEKYLSEIQGKSSIKLYCFTLYTPPGVACLARLRGRGGSAPGRNPLRHRGESCSAPRRKLLYLYIDSQYITGSLFCTSDSTQEVILHNNLQSSLVVLPRAGSTQKFINTRYFPVA